MTRCLSLLLCLLLLGCAGQPPVQRPTEDVFRDALFTPPQHKPDVSRLFAVTPEMRRYLVEQIEPQVRRKGAQMALLDALYTQGELRLEYDARRTRTAAEAFDARMGNCLSLVIMTAAFANELQLQVRFQDVMGVPAIERDGELTFVVGHVNLAMGRGISASRAGSAEADWLIVDFVPGQDLRRQRTSPIDERRVAAMYMNNRAAEELARGQVDAAYWWLRGAFEQDRLFANLYNTLGVVYRHKGALAEAERALLLARAIEPDNEHVAGNLAGVLRLQGREAEATRLAAGLPPRAVSTGTRFDQARAALDAGQLKQAMILLQGELGLTPRNPELHYWLAVTTARMGDAGRARRHLELATEYSGNGEQHALYAGKLQRLKAQAALPAAPAPVTQ